ncbi:MULTISPECIES: DNA-primase RepB domain-containing protein [Sphingomonadaceae]|uniref:DNA-primase RepB domain-containing protein n=1 Tax=Sphingomonadaceae TaxID=41297 RepID=UPI00163BADEC|nr:MULTISPECIES: DNA-primase RepB domain-containing protein [Sphingomonadaceae]
MLDVKTITIGPKVDNPSPIVRAEAEQGQDSTRVPPTNADFCQAIFSDLSAGGTPLITAKTGDPSQGGWTPRPGSEIDRICQPSANTYFNCASFKPDGDDTWAAKKEQAVAYHAVVLDDVGTKVAREAIPDIVPTWELETSPGNFQVGFKLNPPLQDASTVDQLQKRIAAAGLTDKGAGGMARWMRLPIGINGKEKYRVDGQPFVCRMHVWNPDTAYSADTLGDLLAPNVTTTPARQSAKSKVGANSDLNWDVYQPSATENPVLTAFKANRLYKCQTGPGKHEVICPWLSEHTDADDSGTVYYEPSEAYPNGGFRCQHSHGDQYRLREVAEHFGLNASQVSNKPLIRVVQGELDGVVAAAESVLASQEGVFQAGGLIVKAAFDARTGDYGLNPLSEAEVTRILAKGAHWEKLDGRSDEWRRTDPPGRHVTVLHRGDRFDHLLPVVGLARQPYYRPDGSLTTASGYDPISQRIGVFDGAKFATVGTSREDAQQAFDLIDGLLAEFHFVSDTDKAAAFSAILTAAVRPSFDLAPAFHVQAPAPASGKSYLCEVISGFAGPGTPARMSYPKTPDEATKAIMAVLLGAPAVIEFDDMDTDWLPHGSINRMLTSRSITDRILGQSKTATVSTTALVLGSGNNVEPIRDLARRVITIKLNTRSARPGTIQYAGNPVAKLRAEREKYVSAALTIIEAWKAAGSPKAPVPPVASYDGPWTDHCRHPLIWMDLADPASNLIQQMHTDPDAETLKVMLTEWYKKYGNSVKTVRAILDDMGATALHDAIEDLPGQQTGRINRSKLGWYFKKNMNRIVGGYMLEQVPASERVAWKVVKVEGGEPASPPLPAPTDALPENVAREHMF